VSEPDFAPLLAGLDDERERDARLHLLRELHESGVSEADLARAVEEDRLALLPVERLLGSEEPKYSATELAEKTGVDRSYLDRQWQALGFPLADPDEPIYTTSRRPGARRSSPTPACPRRV